MNKTYAIIQVGEFLYAVARNISDGATISIQEIDGKWWLMDGFLAYESIVATNNPSLKGVLQLPPIEEDIYDTVEPPGMGKGDGIEQHYFDMGYYDGYKAAQAKGKFSEEDIRRAMVFALNAAFENPDLDEGGKPVNDLIQDYIKSLSKVPKYIEVDMEDYPVTGAFGLPTEEQVTLPKSINNQIVGRYIWE